MGQLSLAGTRLHHFHICALFESPEEELGVLGPFVKQGLDQREKSISIVAPDALQEYRLHLRAMNIDVADCEACGQLEVVPWTQAYLDAQGVFDRDRMLRTLEEMLSSSTRDGYLGTRIIGDMGWIFSAGGGRDTLIEYEAGVNALLCTHQQPAVCVYDVSRLSGQMLLDLLATHPLALIGGTVRNSPFYGRRA